MDVHLQWLEANVTSRVTPMTRAQYCVAKAAEAEAVKAVVAARALKKKAKAMAQREKNAAAAAARRRPTAGASLNSILQAEYCKAVHTSTLQVSKPVQTVP
jgi:hypothetical protein